MASVDEDELIQAIQDEANRPKVMPVLQYRPRQERGSYQQFAGGMYQMFRRTLWMFGAALLAGGMARGDGIPAAVIGALIVTYLWPRTI